MKSSVTQNRGAKLAATLFTKRTVNRILVACAAWAALTSVVCGQPPAALPETLPAPLAQNTQSPSPVVPVPGTGVPQTITDLQNNAIGRAPAAPLPQMQAGGPVSPQAAPRFLADLDPTVRIKDISFVEGDRVNHVSGEGLVFGLSGTGGKSEQTRVMVSNYYLRKGIQITNVDTKNLSSVLVSGKIPSYARKGETILVTVSVADDAKSLRGGTLHQTVLRGIDDEIYAVAQGPIIGGGVAAGGAAANVQVNHPTVGVCEAIVEREIDCQHVMQHGKIRLVLRNKSYATAMRVTNGINSAFPGHARALDSGTIEVLVPNSFYAELPAFIAMVGDLRVRPDQPARVVVNQKTGTIVMGHSVKISRALFASENIVITTAETPIASQPAPFSQGQTAVLPRTTLDVFETGGRYNVWRDGLTVGDLANALNTLGVTPNTLINVMTSLRNQGSLQAELVIE